MSEPITKETTKQKSLIAPSMKEWEQATPIEREGMTWPAEVLRAIGRNV
jgi:hypothetical protein